MLHLNGKNNNLDGMIVTQNCHSVQHDATLQQDLEQVFTRTDLRAIQAGFAPEIAKYETGSLHLMAGLLNTYIFALTSKAISVVEDPETEKKKIIVDAIALGQVAASDITFTTCVTWTEGYLKKYWPQAFRGRRTIRNMRKVLRDDFNIFHFEDQLPGSTVKPPKLQHAKLIEMLLLFEVIENELAFRFNPEPGYYRELTDEEKTIGGDVTFLGYIPGQGDLEFLPEHGAALVVHAFNALFRDVIKYRRQDESYDTIVLHANPASEPVLTLPEPAFQSVFLRKDPVWKRLFKISRRAWNTLFHRDDEMVMFKDWSVATESDDILQYCRSFQIEHSHLLPF